MRKPEPNAMSDPNQSSRPNVSWAEFAALGAAYMLIGSIAGRVAHGEPAPPSAPRNVATGSTAVPAPARRRAWDIVKNVWARAQKDRLFAVSAGFTFYAILALFPAITAIVSIYGLFANASSIESQLDSLGGFIPGGAVQVIGDEVKRLASQSTGALGTGFAIGLLTAIWSANSGTKAMFDALNVAYEVEETRGFIKLNIVSLLFTLSLVAFAFVAIGAAVALPLALKYTGVDDTFAGMAINLGRWPALFLMVMLALAVLYRFGVSEQQRGWQWISPGAAFATLAWVIASVAFSRYAEQFGSFNKTYGTLGAVIGFMIWIWISAAVVMFGAEINKEMEAVTPPQST
jgi:membrane protein